MSSKVGAKIKGIIKNLDTSKYKKFQYNPEDFSYSRGATYSETVAPGMSYPETQYVHGNSRSFKVELFFFDKPSKGLINEYREFIEDFLPPEDNKEDFVPPKMLFTYGYFIKKCVLEDLEIAIEEYNSDGVPTMARFTLSLRQVT